MMQTCFFFKNLTWFWVGLQCNGQPSNVTFAHVRSHLTKLKSRYWIYDSYYRFCLNLDANLPSPLSIFMQKEILSMFTLWSFVFIIRNQILYEVEYEISCTSDSTKYFPKLKSAIQKEISWNCRWVKIRIHKHFGSSAHSVVCPLSVARRYRVK